MLVHQMFVLPSPETLDYFSKIMSACPFNIDIYSFGVELNSSEYPMVPDIDRVYVAEAGNMNTYYDSSTGQSSLILPLRSRAMDERATELREHAPSAFYGEHFFPFMLMSLPSPQLSRPNRSFIASIASTLAGNHQPLIFEAECILSKDVKNPPFLDYYSAMIANDVHNIQRD